MSPLFLAPLKDLFSLLFPATCDLCQQKLYGNDFQRICKNCISSLNYAENSAAAKLCSHCCHPLTNSHACISCQKEKLQVTQNVSIFFNEGKAKDFLYHYKFDLHPSDANIIASIAIKNHFQYLNQFDIYIPISLGKKGLFEREFCPVKLPASKIAKQLGKLVLPCISRNEKNYYRRIPQHKKNAEQRKKDIKDKYFYPSKYINALSNRKILLFDDVLTTGSTINYTAKLILAHNQNIQIGVFTFFRTLLEPSKNIL